MRPTLRSGDRLRCQALRPRDIIRRGQLEVFEYPSEHSLIFVKRVVGLPGEVVEVADGSVYVNGDPIDEGYYAMSGPGRKSLDMPPARLAPDEYYVMGDNRYASFDSRSFGPVTGRGCWPRPSTSFSPGTTSAASIGTASACLRADRGVR
jgi:signal peptidase I